MLPSRCLAIRFGFPVISSVSVIVYSGIVTTAMLLVGSPLMKVIQIKNQAEAELITAANLLRDIGEGVIPQVRSQRSSGGCGMRCRTCLHSGASCAGS